LDKLVSLLHSADCLRIILRLKELGRLYPSSKRYVGKEAREKSKESIMDASAMRDVATSGPPFSQVFSELRKGSDFQYGYKNAAKRPSAAELGNSQVKAKRENPDVSAFRTSPMP
jgi:hypothetical protein